MRGWLRAFAARAEQIRAVFTALLHELDSVSGPLPPVGSAFADAVGAIGVSASAARRRLGAVVGAWSPWQLAAVVSGGRLLCLSGHAGGGQHELALGSPTVIGQPRHSLTDDERRGGADGNVDGKPCR